MSDIARTSVAAKPRARSVSFVLAELVGTAMLVATVIGSGIMAERLSGGNVALALLANTGATAAMLFVIVTILGPVSGAHLNPVVTLVFALRGELSWARVMPYVAMQILGGIAGAILANLMFDLPAIEFSAHVRTGPSQWLSEVVASFSLVFAILGALRAQRRAVPAVVALVIAAAYWFTASTSFANPAVTIARAFSDSFAGIAPVNVPAFIASQLMGAFLAHLVSAQIFGRQE